MKLKNIDTTVQNKAFAWVAVGTAILLLVPFLLMILKIPLYDPGSGYDVINWSMSDFVMMGSLIFVTISFFLIVIRKVQKKSHRIALAMAFLLGFLWLWAELAVGVFTNWGS
jgi:hypothetical protein